MFGSGGTWFNCFIRWVWFVQIKDISSCKIGSCDASNDCFSSSGTLVPNSLDFSDHVGGLSLLLEVDHVLFRNSLSIISPIILGKPGMRIFYDTNREKF